MELSIFRRPVLGYSLINLQHDDATAQLDLESSNQALKVIYGKYQFLNIIILFMLKYAYYAGIMLDAPTIALCSKLCRHYSFSVVSTNTLWNYASHWQVYGRKPAGPRKIIFDAGLLSYLESPSLPNMNVHSIQVHFTIKDGRKHDASGSLWYWVSVKYGVCLIYQ